ncbi:hypothetical protein GX586_13635 [bacterium]|nr:hypothetical protein [bacterium]
MKRVAVPPLGHYGPVFARGLEALGYECVNIPAATRVALEHGCAAAPEDMCLPFKLVLGVFMDGMDAGAEAIVMFDTRGTCRFRYYHELHAALLEETHRAPEVIVFTAWHGLTLIWRRGIFNALRTVAAWRFLLGLVRLIEHIEDRAWAARPCEQRRGETTAVMRACLDIAAAVSSRRELAGARRRIDTLFDGIATARDAAPPVAVTVGEIYLLTEPASNLCLDETLGTLGIEVRRAERLSTLISRVLPHNRWRRARAARQYLPVPVGGHGLSSVADAVTHARAGVDGIIHLAPFGCMPETTVRPLIRAIGDAHDVPVLTLTFDEQAAQSGLDTRLEAFADVLHERRRTLFDLARATGTAGRVHTSL